MHACNVGDEHLPSSRNFVGPEHASDSAEILFRQQRERLSRRWIRPGPNCENSRVWFWEERAGARSSVFCVCALTVRIALRRKFTGPAEALLAPLSPKLGLATLDWSWTSQLRPRRRRCGIAKILLATSGEDQLATETESLVDCLHTIAVPVVFVLSSRRCSVVRGCSNWY